MEAMPSMASERFAAQTERPGLPPASAPLRAGNPDRLTYGIDSYGHVCGADNTAAGGPDLRAATKLYYLNPLDLLQPSLAFLAARSVCVAACPGAGDQCAVAALPCAADNEYRYDPTLQLGFLGPIIESWGFT